MEEEYRSLGEADFWDGDGTDMIQYWYGWNYNNKVPAIKKFLGEIRKVFS
jgi:hypothetical protein